MPRGCPLTHNLAGSAPRLAIVSDDDRLRWDQRYSDGARAPAGRVDLPDVFRPYADIFPAAGRALDLACGCGVNAVWLARRGMAVLGVDVSPVAITRARDLAREEGVADRCHFQVFDLDSGLPPGPPVDVLLCNRFRDQRLDEAIIGRLARGGLLAMSVLSEVGAGPGAYRVAAGELTRAFGALDVLGAGEGDGQAWLVARARPRN